MKRPLLSALAMLLVAGAPIPSAAQPAIDLGDYARVNEAIATHHVIPRYRAFRASADVFRDRAAALCAETPPRDLAPVREAFRNAMDRWMAAAHIQHGPVKSFMRNFRMHFWPDKGSRSARQLRQLLAQRKDEILEAKRFRSASVAIQGFPAAERLLFGGNYPDRIAQPGGDDYPCRVFAAIARNIADMAAGLAADWTDGDRPYLREILNPGSDDARFASHRDVTADFVKSLHTTLQAVVDFRLDRVLGKSINEARPRRAELWRSGRSLGNIETSLVALQAMYDGENAPGLKALVAPVDAKLADLLSDAFRQTIETARGIDLPLDNAVTDPTARRKVETLAREVRALKNLVSGGLATAIGTPLGFNALDGD